MSVAAETARVRSAAGRSDFWNVSRTELLTRSWNEGLSGHEIVQVFIDAGVPASREKIVAKALRLGLVSHSKHGGKRTGTTRPRGSAPERKPLITRLGVQLIDLTDHICHWPLGDPQAVDFGFCGKPVKVEENGHKRSYCPHHMAIAYAPRVVKP